MTISNQSSPARERRWINPYSRSVREFPGRIFCFERDGSDVDAAQEVLARGRPRIVEIGSGSGNHLIGLARRSPEADCFGFEIRYKRSVRTIQKSEEAGVENVFVFRADARMLPQFFANGSIRELHVNFPDPWEKNRMRKHRLLGAWLLDSAAALLEAGGSLSVKTDHEEYYRTFLKVLRSDRRFSIGAESSDLHKSEFAASNLESEFEALFRSQRLPVYYVKALRADPAEMAKPLESTRS